MIKAGLYCWLAAGVLALMGAGWLCLAAIAAGFVCLGIVLARSAGRLLRQH